MSSPLTAPAPTAVAAGDQPAAPAVGASPRRFVTASRVRKLIGLALPIVAWELNARLNENRLTPTVGEIWSALVDLVSSGDLWFHGRLTLFRGFVGLGIALVVGVVAGFAMARNRWIDAGLQPLLAGLYPIPKLSLYPISILVLGLGGASKIWQVALECFFPIAYNAYAGASSIDRNLVWLSRNTGAGRLRATRDVVLPAAIPSVLTGLRIATPIMLIVIVVTELLGESRGLGFLIKDAQANFDAATALAVVVVLGVLGFVLDRMIVWLIRHLAFWERGVEL